MYTCWLVMLSVNCPEFCDCIARDTYNDHTHNSAKMISHVQSWAKIRYDSFLNDRLFISSRNVNSFNKRCWIKMSSVNFLAATLNCMSADGAVAKR